MQSTQHISLEQKLNKDTMWTAELQIQMKI